MTTCQKPDRQGGQVAVAYARASDTSPRRRRAALAAALHTPLVTARGSVRVLWFSTFDPDAFSPLLSKNFWRIICQRGYHLPAMKIRSKAFAAMALAIVAVSGCKPRLQTRNRLDEKHFPSIILWAWE